MIFILSGPGGVGKDTIARRLIAADPTLRLSRSRTTRPARPTETADDYEFVTRDEFLAGVERGEFFEYAEYLGNLYGTPMPPADADVILVIEVQGAAHVLAKAPGAVMTLVLPPSPEVLAERLRARGDNPERVAERLAAADAEIARGRELAAYVVVNDDLPRAVAEVASILAGHRKS